MGYIASECNFKINLNVLCKEPTIYSTENN